MADEPVPVAPAPPPAPPAPPADAVVDVGVAPADATPPAQTSSGVVDMLKEYMEDSDYEYMEVEDPDKKHLEKDVPGNKFVKAVTFVTRGSAIPWLPLLSVFLYSTLIVGISYAVAQNWEQNTPENCDSRWWCTPIAVDPAVASYVGFALFLLLGFRVNESYARYRKAVSLWNDDISGTIAGFCTYLTMAFRRGLFHENDRQRMLGLIAGYAVSLKRELRDEKDLRELKTMLCEKDLAQIQASADMPGHCLHLIHTYLVAACHKKELKLPAPFLPMLMQMTLNLAGYQGQCMRIKVYKMAYSYGSHLRLFMIIWFMLLPLAIVETSGWLTILWCPFICLGIWGTETAANELANPFGYEYNDIRLGVFTRDIQINIRKIYAKSLKGTLSRNVDTPDMLLVPRSEGGTLPDPEPETKKSL